MNEKYIFRQRANN
jgi:hypothetical protein